MFPFHQHQPMQSFQGRVVMPDVYLAAPMQSTTPAGYPTLPASQPVYFIPAANAHAVMHQPQLLTPFGAASGWASPHPTQYFIVAAPQQHTAAPQASVPVGAFMYGGAAQQLYQPQQNASAPPATTPSATAQQPEPPRTNAKRHDTVRTPPTSISRQDPSAPLPRVTVGVLPLPSSAPPRAAQPHSDMPHTVAKIKSVMSATAASAVRNVPRFLTNHPFEESEEYYACHDAPDNRSLIPAHALPSKAVYRLRPARIPKVTSTEGAAPRATALSSCPPNAWPIDDCDSSSQDEPQMGPLAAGPLHAADGTQPLDPRYEGEFRFGTGF